MKRQILIYCCIAYSITWSIGFGISFLFNRGYISEYQLNLFHAFAAIGPTIGALISTFLSEGKKGVIKLISKIKFGKPTKSALFFMLSPLFFFGLGLILHPIIKGKSYDFHLFIDKHWDSSKEFIVWLLPLLTYSFFEEIGWRGFLLPRLQKRYTAFTATFYLTLLWAFWHFPFFFYRFNFSVGISIGFFFGIFVGAIILTSIYNSSKGMLIPAMLFHFLNNFCSEFDKEIIVAVLSTGFVFLAVYSYKKLGKVNLSENKKVVGISS